MKILLVIDLPGVTEQGGGGTLAQRFADALVASEANEESIISMITSFVPKEKTS